MGPEAGGAAAGCSWQAGEGGPTRAEPARKQARAAHEKLGKHENDRVTVPSDFALTLCAHLRLRPTAGVDKHMNAPWYWAFVC